METKTICLTRRLAGILLALVGSLVALSAGAQETASRTDTFTPTLPRGATVRVENISGDVVASPGASFSATVRISADGPSKTRAQQLLAQARILETIDEKDYALTTRWPREARHLSVTARYELTIPTGVDVVLETVKGDVRVRGLDGEVAVQSVNGSVEVLGARASVSAKTVNGSVDVESADVPDPAEIALSTVNGNVTLTMPRTVSFDLTASTLSGSIVSTFELSRSSQATWVGTDGGAIPRTKALVKVEVDKSESEIEIREIEQELADVEQGVEREVVREMRRFAIIDPRLAYRGRAGRGGPRVSMSALNGRIAVLATGTKVAEARAVVSARRSVVVTIPGVAMAPPRVRIARPVVEVLPPLDPPHRTTASTKSRSGLQGIEGIERGDVNGDFLSTSGGGNYRLGNVSGRVQVLTHWGEIRVASAGGGAELKTHGGDVVIGPVGGSLQARTMAGSIEAGKVGGSVSADTLGGDIRLAKVGGSLNARTLGGDIVVDEVWGSVDAETGGGDVRVRCIGQSRRGIVAIRNSGGDVELTLPEGFRGDVELVVLNADPDERRIRSDFPGLAMTRNGATQRAVGAVNGGGTKVTIRTASGSIRLKKE